MTAEFAGADAPARLRRCLVQIRRPDGGYVGTGFFAAPGVVVTCAHVLRDAGEGAQVRWPAGDPEAYRTADVLMFPAAADGSDFYPFPDLAVMRLANPPTQHPCVQFAQHDPAVGAAVAAAGFTRRTPTPGAQLDSLLLTITGQAHRFLRAAADQVVHGLSGSPIADLATGEVYGVVKATRDASGVYGGWVTPISAIIDAIGPGLVEENRAHHHRSVPLPLPLPLELRRLLRAQRSAPSRCPTGC